MERRVYLDGHFFTRDSAEPDKIAKNLNATIIHLELIPSALYGEIQVVKLKSREPWLNWLIRAAEGAEGYLQSLPEDQRPNDSWISALHDAIIEGKREVHRRGRHHK